MKESDRTENDFRISLRLCFGCQFCGKKELLVKMRNNTCWDLTDPAAEMKSQTIEALERRFTNYTNKGEGTNCDQNMMDMIMIPDFMWGLVWSTVEL